MAKVPGFVERWSEKGIAVARPGDLAEFAAQTNSPPDPTSEAYVPWTTAFAFLNERLFAGALPNCLVTLTRRRNTLGYFCAGAFRDGKGGFAHELSMNPAWFEARGPEGTLSTLAHEMAHLQRHLFGKKNRKGGTGAGAYHDSVWADAMERIGLVPSNTGAPGGKRTGYSMQEYVVEGGPFDLACRELLIAGFEITWRDARAEDRAPPRFPPPPGETLSDETPAPRNTRTRFVCSVCDVKAWSRATAKLACVSCDVPLAIE